MSYQIVDDVLDFVSTDKQLGKPAGSDLLQGNITLPILLMKDHPEIVQFIEKASKGEVTEEERMEMLQIVRNSEAIKEALTNQRSVFKKGNERNRSIAEKSDEEKTKRYCIIYWKT